MSILAKLSDDWQGAMSSTARFWNLLDPTDRNLLRHAGTHRVLARGTVLAREGEFASHLIVLLAGQAKVTANPDCGTEAVLGLHSSGDIIGEAAALQGGYRGTTVCLLEEASLLTIPVDRFRALLDCRATISGALLRVMAHRLRESEVQRVSFRVTTVAGRVTRLLTDLAAEHGRQTERGVEIAVPLRQEDLAGLAGGSRETVARVLRDLRERGVIATRRRQLIILRPQALREHVPRRAPDANR